MLPMPGSGDKVSPAFNPLQYTGKAIRHPYKSDDWTSAAFDQLRLFSVQLLCAGGSGAIAKTAVAPLERVKILMQVQGMSAIPQAERYHGLRDALTRIPLREGGWKAYYRGNGANVLRLVPEVGFRFAMNDAFKILFSPGDGTPLGILEKLAAGAATGVLKTLLFYPLDLARTRITSDMSPAGQPRSYYTVRQCLADTFRREGITGCYKGLLLSMVGIVPYLSVSFTTYDQLKRQLPDDKESRSQWWFPILKMAAGAGAAVTAQTVSYPLDTVRRRMQVNGARGTVVQYRNVLDCMKHMVLQEGIGSFYRGCLVNCIKTMPGAAIQFVAYDVIKTTVTLLDPTTSVTSPL